MVFVSNSNQAIQSESSRTSWPDEAMIQTREEETLSISNGEKNSVFLSLSRTQLLTLTFCPSSILKMSFKEDFDTDAIRRLMNSPHLRKNVSSWTGNEYTTEREQLAKLLFSESTKYTRKEPGFGRVHPIKSISAGCLRRKIRHSLLKVTKLLIMRCV